MILLIENKRDRIGGFEERDIDFDKYPNIQVILYDDKCNNILDEFLEDNNKFNEYDTIIIHETIYYKDKVETLFKVLEQYIKSKNKTLVKFSGQNTQSSFMNNILTIKPSKLYQYLEIFLNEDNSNILMLAYGKNWDLNPLCNYLEKLNIFIETFEIRNTMRSAKFKKVYGLFELEKILEENEYKSLLKNLDFGYKVSLEEMKILSHNFENLIKEKINR